MFLLKITWFLICLVANTLATDSASPSPEATSPSTTTTTEGNSQIYTNKPPIVFTAESARDFQSERLQKRRQALPQSIQMNVNPNEQRQRHPNYYEVDDLTAQEPNSAINSNDNNNNNNGIDQSTGFVEPIDFNSFLSDVARRSGVRQSRDDGFLGNPFVSESRSRDNGFSYLFPTNSRSDDVFEPSFSTLASSASDQNSRRTKQDYDDGFVDPNVQFRSLFDSTETADGFGPQEFLDYQGDTASADVSKGSQTKAYPQFTYSGRNQNYGEEEDIGEDDYDSPSSSPAPAASRGGNNPRFRSSYRQVDSRDPYDDSYYYNGERDETPAAPTPPPQKYKVGGSKGQQSQTPVRQESAHSPQAKEKSESPGGKGKCKKISKLVDQNEDSDAFLEPEADYDPSTYTSRYKRQASRNQARSNKKAKRPMTCHVCEDEQGRYAERCSYDSNADPKQGSYFHSSSTSFNDNGKRPSKGNRQGDRFKRDPSLAHDVKAAETSFESIKIKAAASTNAPVANLNSTTLEPEDLPKKFNKRQSSGGRYASGYPRNGRQQNNRNRQNEYDDEETYRNDETDFYGINQGEADSARREYGFPGAGGGNHGGQRRGNTRDEAFDIPIPRNPGYGSGNSGNSANRGSSANRGGRQDSRREQEADDVDFEAEYGGGGGGGGRRNNNRESNDFDIEHNFPAEGSDGGNRRGSGSSSGSGSGNNRRGQDEFGFGAPQDFGRDNGQDSQGFERFDFSIPRDFDPDVQVGNSASNTNNRPVFSETNEFAPNFDTAYEDYVKQYFPEAFGSSTPGSTGSSGPSGPNVADSPSSTYRPGPSSSQRPAPVYPHGNRGRAPTQQSQQYSPPPYYSNNGNNNEDEISYSPFNGPPGPEEQNVQQLSHAISSFNQKASRPGCQRVQKGDMSCYVCQDQRGMKKEECMYASNDPKNQQMAYHEVSEYSSLPPASILQAPTSLQQQQKSNHNPNEIEHSTILRQESKKVEVKRNPLDYDFDY